MGGGGADEVLGVAAEFSWDFTGSTGPVGRRPAGGALALGAEARAFSLAFAARAESASGDSGKAGMDTSASQ